MKTISRKRSMAVAFGALLGLCSTLVLANTVVVPAGGECNGGEIGASCLSLAHDACITCCQNKCQNGCGDDGTAWSSCITQSVRLCQ